MPRQQAGGQRDGDRGRIMAPEAAGANSAAALRQAMTNARAGGSMDAVLDRPAADRGTTGRDIA
jgi:hypothetical protein